MNKRYAFYGFLTGLLTLLLMGAKITSNILQLGRGTAEDISIQFNTGTANQPLIKWDNTASVLKFSNNGTDFFNFGSGSGGGVGGLSYIENGDFEGLNITGWDEYADAAAATPADGTGGTPNITASFSNVTPLNGDGQLRISKDAANRQGEGISYAFTVPQGYRQGQKAGISFVVDASTANYAAGDLAVYVYDVTNATLITPTVAAIPKAKTPISIAWDQSTGTDFRLIFHITSTNATAYDVYLDDIVIGPKFPGQVPTITPVTSYTPTISGFGTATSVNFEYWQTGEVVSIRGTWTNGTVAGTTASISLPNSWTAAENKIVGRWYRQVAVGTTRKAGTLYSSVGSNLLQFASDDYTSTTAPYNDSLAGNAVSGNTNEMVVVIDGVLINQLVGAGGGYIGQNNVEYAFNTDTTSTASVTSSGFGYGPDGQAFSANFALGTEYTRRVRYLTSVQGTDALDVEVFDSNNPVRWLPIEKVLGPYMRQGTSAYGIRVISVSGSTTDVDVIFSAQGFRASNATYAGNGDAFSAITNFKWRLKKTSGGNAVGFGLADGVNSGLLPTVTSMSGVLATQLGMKQYIIGTAYANGTPTLSSTPVGWSMTRGVLIPRQTQDGTWRLAIQLRGTWTSATSVNFTLSGVTSKNVASLNQALAGAPQSVAAGFYGVWSPNSGTFNISSEASQAGGAIWGEIELESKPTWAD